MLVTLHGCVRHTATATQQAHTHTNNTNSNLFVECQQSTSATANNSSQF